MDLLQNDPSVQEFLRLLGENGRERQQLDLVKLVQSMDAMQKQFEAVVQELHDVKAELAEVKGLSAPEAPTLSKALDTLEERLTGMLEQLRALRDKVVHAAKDAVTNFKESGVAALDKAVSALGVKKGLEHLQDGLQKASSNVREAVWKAEDMGIELRQAAQNVRNAGRIAANKPTHHEVLMDEGRFQKAVLAPMRGMEKVLTRAGNNALAAIGAVESLEQSAKLARANMAERKPSIRQTLAEKKAEIAARAVSQPVRERDPKEAAL